MNTTMCDVKFESEDPEICRSCLSSNRRLSSVATGDYLFLLMAKQKLESGHLVHVALCWECAALLRRTRRFQAQVQRAHKILQDSVPLTSTTPTLSTLTISQHFEYDAVFEETKPDQPLFNEIPSSTINHEKVIVPTKYKSKETMSIEEYEKSVLTDQNDDLKNEHSDDEIKSEPPSDDSEDIDDEDFAAENSGAAEDDNFSSSEEMTDIEDDSEKDDKSKLIVKQPKQTNKTIKKKVTTTTPIKKTPALLRVEQELQKLFVAKSAVPRKKIKLEEDPDYKIEDDEENKPEIEGEKKRIWTGRPDKYKRVITRYTNFEDVTPYFQEIKMGKNDIKNALEKDDAILSKGKLARCNLCGRMFQYARMLLYHGRINHKTTHPHLFKDGAFCNPAPMLPQKSVWRCIICTRMMRREHVVSHMDRYHREKFECVAGGCEWRPANFWEKEDRNRHWKEIHRQFKCDYCDKCKTRKAVLEKHMVTRHAKRVRRPIIHQCHICSKILANPKTLQYHIQFVHNTKEEPLELRYCVECDITFKRIVIFQSHFRKNHSGDPNFGKMPCEQCGKVLRNKKALENHVNAIHMGKTDHCCHICGKYLSKAASLKIHVDKHNNISRPKKKTKSCTVCGRLFSGNRILRFHMYTHTGERPYKCTHCDSAFTQPHCLRVHLAKQHQVEARVRGDGTIVPVTNTKQTNVVDAMTDYLSKASTLKIHVDKHNNISRPKKKTKSCTVCGRLFSENQILRFHMYTHTGERPYKCTHCDSAFTQPHCLRVHLAKQHQVEARVRGDGTIVPVTNNRQMNNAMTDVSADA